MGFCVKELLLAEELKEVKLLGGAGGLDNEIQGVTIIEAPDIVRFIDGGEVLLTGLYAFKSCSVEEFKSYINELTKKRVSALMLKRGRDVDYAEVKIKLLSEFSELHNIPVLEVPFEISFRDIMSLIMARLFNEEVTRLKFFKTTHDNFTALALSVASYGKGIERIVEVLGKLINNPVAVFNQSFACLSAVDGAGRELEIMADAVSFEPGIYSNYSYLTQNNGDVQYIIQVKLNFREKIYLVVTEKKQPFGIMDCIAAESAITALRFEFSRQYAVTELEKKFQNDIMHNILNGKVHSAGELQKNISLLGVPIDGCFRVIVFVMENERKMDRDFKDKMRETNILNDTIMKVLPQGKIYNDLDKIIVIQQVEKTQLQDAYRKEIKDAVEKIQSNVTALHKYLQVKAGVGRMVEGIIHLPDSFKEAAEAAMFVHIAGEISGEGDTRVMLFSDLGIFKLLCQLDDVSMMYDYIPEGLQRLYSYKKPQRDDLIITLKTYLDKNQNLSKTAQDLYVHYKTAAYRIEKIVKITGLDFDNANEVLAVRIGLIVYKMIEKYNKDFI